MDDKIKYQNLSYKLYNIEREMNKLLDKDNDLKTALKDFSLIDNKIIEQEKIQNIQSNNIQIYNELVNEIIPLVNSKN